MLRINLQDEVTLARNRAVANAVNALRARSFGGRHPELGKMIKCAVCNLRHRSSRKCEAIYAKDREGGDRIVSLATRNGQVGRAQFKGKRFLPHHNRRDLQLVQRTQELYPIHAQYLTEPVEIMQEARTQAYRELKKEWSLGAKNKRRQQDTSRRINAHLIPRGSRVRVAKIQNVSTATKNRRQAIQEAVKGQNSGS